MNRRKFLASAGLAGLSAAASAMIGTAKKCESCGAPLKGTKCEYCGTELWTQKDLDPLGHWHYGVKYHEPIYTNNTVSMSYLTSCS